MMNRVTEIDSLSLFFLVTILFVSLLTAVYSVGYFKNQPRLKKKFLIFFPILVAAMSAVVLARDGFWFLIFWEVMSLSSFFLVTAEHESQKVRHAGWIYLTATHLATAFLLLFFALLYKEAGSFSFDDFFRLGPLPVSLASLLFLSALIGFGTKAGLFPFHVWLPHAHPAAPSPISALMSGVMIKTGIYGLLRTLTFLGKPPVWWGELLIVLGVLSAVLGVLYALMQHDLKRLLAYHSVENIGIIVIGIGLGLLGTSLNQPLLKFLGFAGALFHVLNHAVFKSLLFFGAGSVVQANHTRSIERLGGLFKKMPVTAVVFLVASAAICGLPPFNGFISEWLIYVGLFRASQSSQHLPLFMSVAGIVGIAFAGGLAVVCFTKLFGVVFLGLPRDSKIAADLGPGLRDPSLWMKIPMAVLALLCAGLGLYPQAVLPFLPPMAGTIGLSQTLSSLNTVCFVFASLVVFTAALGVVWNFWLSKKPLQKTVTWDCGTARPSARMQYSASSFAEPVGVFFKALLKPAVHFKGNRFEEHIEDFSERVFFIPLFSKIAALLLFIRNKQRTSIQAYLTLIFATLIILLLWEVWFGI